MKTILRMLAVAVGALVIAAGAAALDTGFRLIDRGMGEGDDMRLYDIVCHSGARTKLDHYFVKGEVCYYAASNGAIHCIRGNDLDAAAVKACNE